MHMQCYIILFHLNGRTSSCLRIPDLMIIVEFRYPDDPYDIIWESDMVRQANYLVDMACSTVNVSTNK